MATFFTVGELSGLINAEYDSRQGGVPMSQCFKTDSRDILPGDVFVAVKGSRVDGHDYLSAVSAAGAAAALVERSYYDSHRQELDSYNLIYIRVDGTERALAEVASNWLSQVAPRVVGITGSVGKTTTREFLKIIASGNLRTHVAIRSYNTLIGCAMTVLAMPADTELLVLELGTNHPGEIGELVRFFPVSDAVITEIVPAHLEGLKSLEGVLAAKMEITGAVGLKSVVYNGDNELLKTAVEALSSDIKKVGVGFVDCEVEVHVSKQSLTESFEPRIELELTRDGRQYACCANIFGKQHAKNLALAFAAASELGVAPDDICEAMSKALLPIGRGGIYPGLSDSVLLDESYNANPGSVSYALKNVLELELCRPMQKVAILGGMRELGDETRYWHDVIMSRASLFDAVYLIGSEWDEVMTQQSSLVGRWKSTDEFIEVFDLARFANSLVLIKGSRFYELERVLPLFGVERR